MLGGTERLLWLLLLLLLPRAWGHGGQARPREGTEEAGSARAWLAFQGLRERLGAAGAFSRHYWARFSCRVWPQDCGEDEEASARSPGKTVGLRRAGAGRRDARGPLGSGRGVQSLVPVLGRRERGHQTSALAAGSAVPPSLLAELKAGQPLRNREPSSLRRRPQRWLCVLMQTSGPGCTPRRLLAPPDTAYTSLLSPNLPCHYSKELLLLTFLMTLRKTPSWALPTSTLSSSSAAYRSRSWATSPPNLTSDLFSVTDKL